MSDCFDHMVDAYESLDRAMDEGFTWCPRRRRNSWVCNPDYYHVELSGYKVLEESAKCLLVDFGSYRVWIPKTIIRKRTDASMLVHANTFYKLPRLQSAKTAFA